MSEHLAAKDVLEGQTIALDEQAIRDRACEISQRPDAGTPEENWRRAQGELREERQAAS